LKEFIRIERGKWILIILASVFVIVSTPLFKIERCEADLESEKSAFLTLINQYRQQNGLPPLSVSNALTIAAQRHSEDMARRNYFSHTTPEGKTFVDRIREAGYTYNTCLGENIAAGFSTAQSVFEAWKNSPGHNQNMLNPCFKVIGIGLAYEAGSTYKWYWTTDFGGYDDSGSGGGGGGGGGGYTPSNNPPYRPAKPSGPAFGHIDENHTFTTYSEDPDGDQLMYIFDWGDGTTSTTRYVDSGTQISLTHSWSKPGEYSVRVMAKDKRGASSPWSPTTIVKIIVPKLKINLSSNIPGVEIIVDGVKYSTSNTFEWLKKTVHNVSVPKTIEFMEGGRYFFKGWSDGVENNTRVITVRENMFLTAIYEVQYLFTFKTYLDNLTSNWYPNGTVLNLSVEPFIYLKFGERLAFKKWSNNITNTNIEIVVDKPGFIEALWCKQYLLKVDSSLRYCAGGGWYDENSTAFLRINSSVVELGNGTRRVFEAWVGEGEGSYSGTETNLTIIVRNQINETAIWRTEYLVNVETEHGKPSGAGWYNVSSIASVFLEPVVYDSPVVRYVFQGWEEILVEDSNNITIKVESPVFLKAVWKTEYYLNVSSEYGEAWGSGWYSSNSCASFGVKPPSFHIIPYVFEGWEGDSYSRDLNATIIIDKPKKVLAKWRRDYTWVVLIAIILVVATIIAHYLKRRKREKKS